MLSSRVTRITSLRPKAKLLAAIATASVALGAAAGPASAKLALSPGYSGIKNCPIGVIEEMVAALGRQGADRQCTAGRAAGPGLPGRERVEVGGMQPAHVSVWLDSRSPAFQRPWALTAAHVRWCP